MKFGNKDITAILAIVVGILFIVMKSSLLRIVIALLGFALFIVGIMMIHLVREKFAYGAGLMAAGLIIAFCGWQFTWFAPCVGAVLMIVTCTVNFIMRWRNRRSFITPSQQVHAFLKPVIGIFAGACLLFNQGGTASWVYIVAGLAFVIEGVLMLSERSWQ